MVPRRHCPSLFCGQSVDLVVHAPFSRVLDTELGSSGSCGKCLITGQSYQPKVARPVSAVWTLPWHWYPGSRLSFCQQEMPEDIPLPGDSCLSRLTLEGGTQLFLWNIHIPVSVTLPNESGSLAQEVVTYLLCNCNYIESLVGPSSHYGCQVNNPGFLTL